MGLKGVDRRRGFFPGENNAFRTSWTVPEGAHMPTIHEARIIDVNLVNWTVDVFTVFDQKRYFDIQVASPYLHPNFGEGIYAFPEIGSKCVVCIPSDGPPPFVLAFIMPPETIPDASSDEAPQGTQGQTGGDTQNVTDSTYRGGRARAKPGDIVMKGRDGNFVVLHRGGVLQIGSTQLAQRIYIPLGNFVTDISRNYNHFNTGGSINWGLRPGSPEEKPESEWRQTFRVFANDEFADMRVAIGKVHNPVQEKVGDAGSTSDLNQLGIGVDVPIVAEFAISPGGFDTDVGAPVTSGNVARDNNVFRMFFDRAGGMMLRAEGAISVRVKDKLRIKADGDIDVLSDGAIAIEAGGPINIQAGGGINITGDGVIKLNGGSKPVATVGSTVSIVTTVPIPIQTSMGPGTITAGAVFSGNVQTGNPTVLA